MTTEPPPPSRSTYEEEPGVPSETAATRAAQTPAAAEAAAPPRQRPRGRGWLAIGLLQSISLLGIVALAVIAGAILVDDTKVPGWIDGLAIGAGSVILTLVVLFNGQRANRARHPRRRAQ